MTFRRRNRGMNMIETVLGIAVLTILIVGVASFQVRFMAYRGRLRAHAYARQAADSAAEELLARGYEGLAACSDEPYEAPGLEKLLGLDARCSYDVRPFDLQRPGLKVLAVTVRWNFDQPEPSRAETQRLLAARTVGESGGSSP